VDVAVTRLFVPLRDGRISMKKTLLFAVCASIALGSATASDAAQPEKGAFYGAKTVVTGGIGPGNSDDPTVRIRVARNGRTLDVLGPHDDCNHGSGGFNAFEYFYPKVDDVRIKPDGSFQGSTTYVQEFDGSHHHYAFPFEVKVKGRFVSEDTAKGSFSWQMTVDSTRNEAGPSPCPPLKTTFSAKRGNVVGLKAVKMPSRTKWHPEGQVP
jgi:opacity protein-like surface antigen